MTHLLKAFLFYAATASAALSQPVDPEIDAAQLKQLAEEARSKAAQFSFEEFRAQVPFVEETGKFYVNGDTPVRNEKLLREFWEQSIRTAPTDCGEEVCEFAVITVGGLDQIWSQAERHALSYCVSAAFGSRHPSVVADMAAATAAWEAVADLDFVYIPTEDSDCNTQNTRVHFDVLPVNAGGQFFAAAFFPNDPRADRSLVIDPSLFQLDPNGNLTLRGILRHELGHAIGGRHEHTRPEAGTRFEDPDWLEQMAPQSPTDLTLESLQRNLGPIGTVEPYQGPAEPLAAEQELLFRLINHLADGESGLATVGVAVFDSQVTSGHCDLPTMFYSDWETDAPPILAPINLLPAAGAATVTVGGGCSTRDPLAQTDADHAIAVAGIIVAQKNGRGIVGINPAARLLLARFGRDELPGTLIRELKLGFPPEVRVANLSFRVAAVNPAAIKNALAFHSSTILVVAAAGNEGFRLGQDCAVYPACFNDLDNVITVVGLNSDLDNPGFWKAETESTNTSPAFEIGAPAQGVMTTVTNDRFDVKQGTSFAAPQVAAAASLVFAAGEAIYGGDPEAQLSPKTVKDRLIYTADFFPALVRELYAGRLNVGRAAAVRDAQFDLFDGRRVVGRVDEAPAYFNCKGPADATEDIPWADVRRLTYIDDWTRHILYRHNNEGHGNRDANLVRDLSCSVGTKSPLVRVATIVDGVPRGVEFQFLDIRDYTSPLFFR